MNLSAHFTLAELTASATAAKHGIDNTPTPEVLENLTDLAQCLENVREVLGHPIQITSGYRSPALNSHPEIGGAVNSAHATGQAADFIAPGFGSPLAICQRLQPLMRDLGIDQLIHEHFGHGSWVHLGIAESPRYMAMTIDHSGMRYGFA
jgi:uncharacterized protein YcbK (DUF882 family)